MKEIAHENLHKNVNENLFSFTFLCKFSYIFICYFCLDFHEIFNNKNGNDIHHFGKFLLIFDLGSG